MDLVSQLLERLQSSQASLDLLHVLVQNWIVFQRDTFDIFDDYGDPFTTQTFLIEIYSGRYIHRAQGSKVDFGVSLDVDVLFTKITEAFVDFKVCQGFMLNAEVGKSTHRRLREFPYERITARKCQNLYRPTSATPFKIEGRKPRFRWICPACQELGDFGPETRDESHSDSIMVNPTKSVLVEESDSFSILEEECLEVQEVHLGDEGLSSGIPQALPNSPEPKTHGDVKKIEKKRAKKGHLCNHCGTTFANMVVYQRHQRKKRNVGCKECSKIFCTFKELIEHVYVSHSDAVDGYFKYGQDRAELAPQKAPKQCSLCDLVCNGNILLFRHRELYHELGDYKCATCQEPCLTYYDLMLHNYKKHDQALEQLQPQTNGLEAVHLPDGKVEYKRVNFACQHCDAIYISDTSWTKHMREKHSWDLFECKPCDETCHYAADFSAHMLTYHPDKPEIKCPTQGCAHVSNLKEDPDHFNEHFRNCLTQRRTGYHAVDKFAAQCDKCGKKYATKRCFDAHLKQHQGFELYKCAHCDYGTNHKAVLVDHEKVHLREKGLTNADTDLVLYHQCDKCDKKFSKKRVLLAHMKRAHEGIPIYRVCKDCNEKFISHSSLYNHKRKVHGFVSSGENTRWRWAKKVK